MSVTGRVINGVVVLPPGTMLPEGASVKVEAVQPATGSDPFVAAIQEILYHQSGSETGCVAVELPDDLAANHDYYIHGHSRKQQPRTSRWLGSLKSTAELTEQEAAIATNELVSMAAETTELPADLSTNHNYYLHGLPRQ